MLSVASGHFASQWKTERTCFHGSDARILLQGLISSYSEQCLCDNSAFCGKEVGRVGVTQEFSICKDTFFVANFVRGVSLHFTSTNSHSQISHCADAFIWLGKKNPIWNVTGSALKGLVFELKGSPVLACLLHWAWLQSDPRCWINARLFLRSAHLTGQY